MDQLEHESKFHYNVYVQHKKMLEETERRRNTNLYTNVLSCVPISNKVNNVWVCTNLDEQRDILEKTIVSSLCRINYSCRVDFFQEILICCYSSVTFDSS
mmetsp:Transcript_999/g.1309  ORF Transcript_999/g.1309 Transcript_999/m.1309 type:complete len:100 (+) Transcript_999:119-418(+)